MCGQRGVNNLQHRPRGRVALGFRPVEGQFAQFEVYAGHGGRYGGFCLGGVCGGNVRVCQEVISAPQHHMVVVYVLGIGNADHKGDGARLEALVLNQRLYVVGAGHMALEGNLLYPFPVVCVAFPVLLRRVCRRLADVHVHQGLAGALGFGYVHREAADSAGSGHQMGQRGRLHIRGGVKAAFQRAVDLHLAQGNRFIQGNRHGSVDGPGSDSDTDQF